MWVSRRSVRFVASLSDLLLVMIVLQIVFGDIRQVEEIDTVVREILANSGATSAVD